MAMLQEAHRVLDDSPESYMLIDTPDPTRGHYAEAMEELQSRAAKIGAVYKEKGYIIDSPDGESFYDRVVPTPEQFKAMALLTGFRAEQVAERKFSDTERHTNLNIYWKLTKLKQPPTTEELQTAQDQVKTSHPFVSITWL